MITEWNLKSRPLDILFVDISSTFLETVCFWGIMKRTMTSETTKTDVWMTDACTTCERVDFCVFDFISKSVSKQTPSLSDLHNWTLLFLKNEIFIVTQSYLLVWRFLLSRCPIWMEIVEKAATKKLLVIHWRKISAKNLQRKPSQDQRTQRKGWKRRRDFLSEDEPIWRQTAAGSRSSEKRFPVWIAPEVKSSGQRSDLHFAGTRLLAKVCRLEEKRSCHASQRSGDSVMIRPNIVCLSVCLSLNLVPLKIP